MTKNEFVKIADATRTYYPRHEFLPNKEALSLWYEELKDIPYTIAATALRMYVNTPKNVFPPSIADFREYSTLLTKKELTEEWSDKWADVISAIRNYGMWDEKKALESMDETTKECVRRIGWKEICMSENLSIDRANFRMIYEQIKNKNKIDSSMPSSLNDIIQKIQEGSVKQIE